MAQARFEITATDKTAGVFASIDKNLQALAGRASSVTGLVEGYFGFEGLEKVLEVTKENEKAQALLASQIKATGDASGLTLSQLLDMADGFQQTTTYSHVQIEQLDTELMAFRNIAGTQFKGAIQAALDFATVTRRDPVEAVRTLGMALNDPATGMQRLSRAGIELSQSIKDTVKAMVEQGNVTGAQSLLLQEMEKSYGGAASAARDTLGGAIAGLKNDFESLLEGDGAGLHAATDGIKDLDKTLQDPQIKQGCDSLVAGLLEIVGAGAQVVEKFTEIGQGLGVILAGGKGDAIQDIGNQLGEAKKALTDLQDDQQRALHGQDTLLGDNADQLQVKIDAQKAKIAQLQGAWNTLLRNKNSEAPQQPKYVASELDSLIQGDFSSQHTHVDQFQPLEQGNYAGFKSAGDQLKEDQQKVIEIWKQNDPAAYIQQQIAETKALVGTVVNGQIFTTEDAEKHIEDLKDKTGQAMDQMSEFAKEAAHNIQDEFSKGLFDNFHNGLRGMFEDWAKMLEKMMEQLIASQLLDHSFGDGSKGSGESSISGFLGALFSHLSSNYGGGYADGGSVDPSNFYMVGEQGPELFVPASAGTIVPNYALGGGVNITNHVDARGADPGTAAQLIALMGEFEHSLKGQVEYRLQRGGWMNGRRR